MLYSQSLSEQLGAFLARSDWSERVLARRSGVSRATIRHWMSANVRKPGLHSLLKVASALDLNVEETDQLLASGLHQPLNKLLDSPLSDGERRLVTQWEMKPSIQRILGTANAPQMMPPAPWLFIGRKSELTQLQNWLTAPTHESIYILHGFDGVGKTTIATQVAHQFSRNFRDGVLWANLSTSTPEMILQLFSDAYGHDVSAYSDLASRSSAYRSFMTSKQALIVLEDVSDSDEIQWLLPATNNCAILITTCNRFLHIRNGANLLNIVPYHAQQAEQVELCRSMLERLYIDVEYPLLEKLVDLVGDLPLTISALVRLISYYAPDGLEDLLTDLEKPETRLDLFCEGEIDFRSVYGTALEQVSQNAQYIFSLLGIFGGVDFDINAVVAVSQMKKRDVRLCLKALESVSLVQKNQKGRYYLHRLLKDFSLDKLNDEQAWKKMVRYYLLFLELEQANLSKVQLEISNISAALKKAHDLGAKDALLQGALSFCALVGKHHTLETAPELFDEAYKIARLADNYKLNQMIEHVAQTSFGHSTSSMLNTQQSLTQVIQGISFERLST